MRDYLVDQFKNIGLELKLLKEPIRRGRRGTEEIFQMDIGRKVEGTRRNEWFIIYPGHENNVVQIIDIDQKLNQLLLLVHEPVREFVMEEIKSKYESSRKSRRTQLNRARNTTFTETETHFIITSKTEEGKRHFLMGVDERQLFVAQLKKGVSSIVEARKQLGNTVLFHEGARKMTPGRQGEWFFVKATKVQEEIIELLVEKNSIFILTKESIGKHAGKPQGNSHTADELVVIPNNPDVIRRAQASKYARKNTDLSKVEPIYPIRQKEVFVRGCIRHVDHKTIKYGSWYQVILNNEGNTREATQSWID
jgi:hypothetical protein